jgi:UDP-glucose 4-epimerase
MRYLVTGGAGYIGSHIVDALLYRRHEVIVVDNMSTGQEKFIEHNKGNKNFQFIKCDLNDDLSMMEGVDGVYHFAAHADIRKGFLNPKIDIRNNILATSNLLESMRKHNVRKLVFASTSAVLGEVDRAMLPAWETIPMPEQTSLYGASKLAGEGLISAYCEGYDLEAYAFRFVTVLGPRYPHGFAFDFVKKLLNNPYRLDVLGDGRGVKSSIHVSDVVNAVMMIGEDIRPARNKKRKYEVFNIGNDMTYQVSDAAKWVADAMGLKPEIVYGDTIKGWPGDIPYIHLNTTKIKQYDWRANHTPKKSIYETVDWLLDNRWIYEARQ